MEMDILQAVGQVGFPIVAFLIVYVDLRKVIIKHTEAINDLIDVLTNREVKNY